MKYIVGVDGIITCEYVGRCGSCRVKEHSHHDCMPGDTLVGFQGLPFCIGCGEPGATISECQQLQEHGIHEVCRGLKASSIATRYGGFDGAHHKQWVIDQMVRAVLSKEGYEKWLAEMNSDTEYDHWDHGTPP